MSTPNEAARELINTIEASRIPSPGLYRNLPFGEYHHWGAVSNSQLQRLKRSPAHLRYYLDNPEDPTESMVFGSAVHCAILEPDMFTAFYACDVEGDRRTKKYQEAHAALVADRDGAHILAPADYAAALAIRDAANRCASVKALIHGAGDLELSFAWDQPVLDGDARCKGRADRVSWEIAGGTIVDLKTTRDARKNAFERAIFNFGYYNQGAMYVDGIRAHRLAIKHYTIVAIEKEPPFGICPYRLRDEVLEAGRRENAELLAVYLECLKVDAWPCYDDEITDIGLPDWAWRNIETEITR